MIYITHPFYAKNAELNDLIITQKIIILQISQETMTSVDRNRKPVLVKVTGTCINSQFNRSSL